MLKYTFFGGKSPNTLEEAKELIRTSDKPCKYTYGLGFRNPTTNHVPISKEDALECCDKECLLDIDEYEDYIHLNAYSSNDMW